MSVTTAAIQSKLDSMPVPVAIVMPDGTTVGSSNPKVTMRIKDRAILLNIMAGQVGQLGEDYVDGKLDIDGSMRDLMQLSAAILPNSPIEAAQGGWFSKLAAKLISVWRHSIERDARQIEFHYDLSDDFYALWLDPHRVYSCAYYKKSDYNLNQAQEAKLDHICKKLDLRAGERFLDVGAGWGGLLLWAAKHYGVNATGITLSKNQHQYVNQLIKKHNLSDSVSMHLLDYRKLDVNQRFDKIASVGMFEHVGIAQLTEYFSKLNRLLKPGGLLLNHGITAGGINNASLGAGMGDFIEKFIFPGGELTHISQVLVGLSSGGFEDVDIENLRPHYARTLWAWSDALENRLEEAKAILNTESGEKSLRAYRIYLAGCAMGFEHGWIGLHQVLAKPCSTGRNDELDHPKDLSYPWRRDYIYK